MEKKSNMANYTTSLVDFFKYLPEHVNKTLTEYQKQLPYNRFHLYKEYLLNHTETKQVKFNNNRWVLRPYLFCFDNYSESEQYLYPVILTVNNICSIHWFTPDKFLDQNVYVPSVNIIKKILTFK